MKHFYDLSLRVLIEYKPDFSVGTCWCASCLDLPLTAYTHSPEQAMKEIQSMVVGKLDGSELVLFPARKQDGDLWSDLRAVQDRAGIDPTAHCIAALCNIRGFADAPIH